MSTREFGPLAITTILEIEPSGPRYVERIADGDVAYWGLILAAEGDPAIADYLWSCASEGLWEYQRGHGPTAADSALVIEGLAAAGATREQLEPCLDRLVERHFDRASGGFTTVVRGRAAYWLGPSVDTTAQVAWLLARLAPERHPACLAAALDYLRAAQHQDGTWASRWYPSRVLPTWLVTRVLATTGVDRAALGRARLALLGRQAADGSWDHSVIDTAAGLRALGDPHSSACQRAGAWLRRRGPEGRWPGEPILSYWFEDEVGARRLYLSVDAGRITSAYASLALRVL